MPCGTQGWPSVRLWAASPFGKAAGAAVWNLAVAIAVLLIGRYATTWVIGLAAGLRLARTTVNLASAPVYSEHEADESVIADIGIERPERLAETGARLQQEEENRVAADRGWIAALLTVLFVIHVSRMGFDRSALAILSPLVAVLGDVVFALALAYLVIVPLRLSGRRMTRRSRATGMGTGPRGCRTRTRLGALAERAVRFWLESRMRFAIRVREARYSLSAALGRGLQIGLPLAAIIVASVPIWGMSWYFDTENWAAGHLELVGRPAHRHVARGDGPRGRQRRSDDARRSWFCGDAGRTWMALRRFRSSSSATPARATRASTCCATR